MIPRLGRNGSRAAGALVALVVVLLGVAPVSGSVAAATGAASPVAATPSGTADSEAAPTGTHPQTATLDATFDPRQVAVGGQVQLFVESSRANAVIRVSSPQLSESQVETLLRIGNDPEFSLDSNGEWSRELFVQTSIDPGEYELVFRDVDTGAETTAVLEVTPDSSVDLSAAFEPQRVPQGQGVELVVESSRANADIDISSPQIPDELLRELITPRVPGTNVTLDGDGQWAGELPTDPLEPGEYEFVFRDTDYGTETTAVLEVTSGETATPVPESGDMFAQFEPRQVQVGDGSVLTIEGRPGADIRVSSPQLSTGQLQEVIPYEITLDEEGRFANDIGVPGFLDPGEYELVFTDPETGAETTAVLEVTGEGGPSTDSAEVRSPTVESQETPLPQRGFFVNGESDPLGPLSNFLNLTVIGFLLSVAGIFYQLMEGR